MNSYFVSKVLVILISIGALDNPNGYIKNGETANIPIVLTEQPINNVTVNITKELGDFTLNTSSVIFTNLNWNVSQNISVTKGNQTDEGITKGVITFDVISSDIAFQDYEIQDHTFEMFDNDYSESIVPYRDSIEERYVNSFVDFDSLQQLETYRQSVIDTLFTDLNGLPSNPPESIDLNYSTPFVTINSSNFQQINRLKFEDITNEINYVYDIIPTNWNNKVVIDAIGHGDSWTLGNHAIIVDSLLDEGYRVMSSYMVNFGENSSNAVAVPNSTLSHSNYSAVEASIFTPNNMHILGAFVGHFFRAVEYASLTGATEIAMMGYSGGAWTTVLVSALDTRISKTFGVAGSGVIFVHKIIGSGDFEQGNRPAHPSVINFYTNIASYEDLYVLCSTPSNRTYYHIRNETDACCYQTTNYQSYLDNVIQESNRFEGNFIFNNFNQAGFHGYTGSTTNYILSSLQD